MHPLTNGLLYFLRYSGGAPTSADVIKTILEHKTPALPHVSFSLIDVRDVATAHVKAMTLPEAAGNRHIIHNSNHWMTEMGEILAKEFASQGYKPVTVSEGWFQFPDSLFF